MRKWVLIILFCLILTGCGNKPKTLYGAYTDVTTAEKSCVYQKSYLMMDCCDEWNDFYDYVSTIKNAVAIEGYEYYLYDKNGNKVIKNDKKEVIFYPTKGYLDKIENAGKGHYEVYSFEDKEYINTSENEQGYPVINTKKQGIFVLAYISEDTDSEKYISNKTNLYISNEECDGQCRTCE